MCTFTNKDILNIDQTTRMELLLGISKTAYSLRSATSHQSSLRLLQVWLNAASKGVSLPILGKKMNLLCLFAEVYSTKLKLVRAERIHFFLYLRSNYFSRGVYFTFIC